MIQIYMYTWLSTFNPLFFSISRPILVVLRMEYFIPFDKFVSSQLKREQMELNQYFEGWRNGLLGLTNQILLPWVSLHEISNVSSIFRDETHITWKLNPQSLFLCIILLTWKCLIASWAPKKSAVCLFFVFCFFQ